MSSKRPSARRLLDELEACRSQFGPNSGAAKLGLLAALERTSLLSASDVLRLHDALCFLRALPDDAALLSLVERMLADFARRADLRRFRNELANSGIAGTDLTFLFFAATARWLAHRFPGALRVEWSSFERSDLLDQRLQLLASYAETPGLDEVAWPMEQWVRRLAGPNQTDAEFLVRRCERIGRTAPERDMFYDELGLELVLASGTTTPARTREKVAGRPVCYQTRPLRRERPDVRRELAREPTRVIALSVSEGQRVVDLAREAMIVRQRDLDAFIHGDARDVRLVDCGDGLEFACIGVRPERRLMLESVYACLTLQNGVPIGYVLTSALFGSSEIAYNVFDTWRGGAAGYVYGRVLAMARHVFGSRTFTVYPYQLGGDGNTEGLKSGAWWFYQKLGFRAREPEVLQLMERELAQMQRDPEHRSSVKTLKQLAASNVYWSRGRSRDDVIGVLELPRVGVAVTDYLARRFGADRERGERVCAEEAGRMLGVRTWKQLPPGQRLWWTRWAPLVCILPGVESWTAAERAELGAIMRAKGGRRESEFVLRFDRHSKLRRALRALINATDID